ncbi:MAG: hypothetical protein FD174_381 [Geobacteraceae bacterium]|nr:MAG: hypothetical protein FD174_381 [Geobacteraceae bacterium]
MRRFFIPSHTFTGNAVTITGDTFRHMVKVLRLKAGARLLLANGEGQEAEGVIQRIDRESLIIALGETRPAQAAESGPRITLYQGLPKGDKMDLIVQKSTELGVAEIVPFLAARSVTRVRGEQAEERVARWQRIAQEAARQSQRTSIPRVSLAGDLAAVLCQARNPVKLLLWEEERTNRLKEALASIPHPESIAVIVGPEGGLSSEEAEAARENGFCPISLGKRIVRTETASLVILAILQFYWGDIG